jgi:hypothetical protein
MRASFTDDLRKSILQCAELDEGVARVVGEIEELLKSLLDGVDDEELTWPVLRLTELVAFFTAIVELFAVGFELVEELFLVNH